MDFKFAPEEEAFRTDVREFLDKELPQGWLGHVGLGDHEDREVYLQMKKKLAQKGWLTLAWPEEYGGMGASHMQQLIFSEEMAYRRAPGVDSSAIKLLGPTLMIHGNEEQKADFLPPIARGESQWAQGYSEPGSGSDLASLQTSAVEDGDDFVINGSKIWTSRAHWADHFFMLARTDPDAPKHRGISFFLLDADTPGITIRPIVNMLGLHEFNQVFFDNVRIPKRNLVGEQNRGWYIGATLLDFERSGVEYPASGKHALELLVRYCKETKRNGKTLSQDPLVRRRLADTAIEVEASRLLCYEVAWMQSQGMLPNKEASMGKVFGTEVQQRLAATGMRILGLYGQLAQGDPRAPLDAYIERMYLATVSWTIGAGTSEIQRNIIATRGLGLPRG